MAPQHRAHLERRVKHNDFGNDAHHWLATWASSVAQGLTAAPTLIFDIGANVGQSGSYYLSLFPAELTVHSYELSRDNFRVLQAAWQKEQASAAGRWLLHNEGMSSSAGVAHYSSKGPGDQTATLGQHSALQLKHDLSTSANITTLALALEALPPGQVVDLAKIDTEGWERDIIKGAALERNAARIRALYFEHSSTWVDERAGPSKESLAQLVARLDEQGYECFLAGQVDLVRISPPFDHTGLDVVGYGPNGLCLHRDAPASRVLVQQHKSQLEVCLWP